MAVFFWLGALLEVTLMVSMVAVGRRSIARTVDMLSVAICRVVDNR